MEAPPPAVRPRVRIGRRKLLAIVASAAIVVGAFVTWEVVRARSIAEVFAMDHLQPGTQIAIQGTITGVGRETTSYGPRVYLQLDHNTFCQGLQPWVGDVLGDPNASYRIGDAYQTTLHLQGFSINGDAAVWAPELACPFPTLFRAMGMVFDSIAFVRGILLAYNGTDASGWTHYEILTKNGDGFRPDVLPVALLKALPVRGTNPPLPAGGVVDSAARWQVLSNLIYVEASAALSGSTAEFPIVDRMNSLTAGTSANGTLRFVDGNAGGLVDSGDRLDVRLPSAGSANSWETYILEIGVLGGAAPTYAGSTHFLLTGPQGPLEVPLANRNSPLLDLRYAGSTGWSRVNMTIEVGRLQGIAPSLSTVRFGATLGTAQTEGNLSDLPVSVPGGASLAFDDATNDGLLDVGDRFTVQDVANHSGISLVLQAANTTIAFGSWIAGWGTLVGAPPFVTFTHQGTDPWEATAHVATWSPELNLTRTLRATLYENGIPVLSNVTLANGAARTFANGTLTFTDADGDGYLSAGDFFTLQANATDSYVLDVWYLFNSSWLALVV